MQKAKILVPCAKNNSWVLKESESAHMFLTLYTLSGTMENIQEGDSSYGGVEIQITDYEQFRIYKGILELITENQIRKFSDIGREFELWLFSTGRDKVDDSLYNQLLIREFQ